MNTNVPFDPKTKEPLSPVYKRKVPKRTREALHLRIREGLTWAQCAERAGMAESSLFKAIKQPHVKALMAQIKDEFIQEVAEMRAPYKAQALEVARELLHTSKSDAVRARMVEFLAGEPKGNAVNVAVQVNNQAPQGYEFVRPGQKLVEIQSPGDSQSPADDAESP